jgi:hypothetical protein
MISRGQSSRSNADPANLGRALAVTEAIID